MWALTFRLSLLLFLTLLSPQAAQSAQPQFFHQLQHHHHPLHSISTITQSQKSFNGELAASQPPNPIATVKESSKNQDQMAAHSISISPASRANLGLNPNPISPPSAGSPCRVNSENKGGADATAAKRLRRALIDVKSSETMITPMPLQPGENLTDSVFKSMMPRGVPVPPSGPSRSHNSKITDSD